ncbi:hypothetical protein KEM56_006462 [Ascosphaera pollenicola]|nr:hypothetical protein KEM56_006462 [Ascosphaera pollenicola]
MVRDDEGEGEGEGFVVAVAVVLVLVGDGADEPPAVTLPLTPGPVCVPPSHEQHQQQQDTQQSPSDCSRSIKYCVKSVNRRRAKRHNHLPDRYVIGWPEDEAQDVSYSMFRPCWEKIRNDLVDSAYNDQDPLFNPSSSMRNGCCQNIWGALPPHADGHHLYSPSSTGLSDSDDRSITSSSLLRTVKTASISGTSSSRVSTVDRPPTIGTFCAEPGSFNNTSFSSSSPPLAAASGPNTKSTRKRTSVDSVTSDPACRDSVCSNFRNSLSLDEAAWNRAVQRRQILRELVDTESTYVIGLKALADALSTYIATRTTIYRSALELLALHQRLLGKLTTIIPRADSPATSPTHSAKNGDQLKCSTTDNTRFSSQPAHKMRSAAERNIDRKSLASKKLKEPVESRIKSAQGVAAQTVEAAKVAELLRWSLPQFDVYEDYGVTFQMVKKELEIMRKSMSISNWQVFDHGIETLVKSVAPDDKRAENARQGFTLEDLLLKPIQRVCKYQLFLAGLLKCTPVIDDPLSHAVIDAALQGMLEVNQNINRVTGDPILKDRIYRTLLLREKLGFSRQPYKDVLREFGPLRVCGVLHVAYQTEADVHGEYMLCCLFNAHLLFAVPIGETGHFDSVAVLKLVDVKLEMADNEIGLHCDTTHFTFKIAFKIGETYHEFILTACSEKEANQWKEYISRHSSAEVIRQSDQGPNPSTRGASTVRFALKPLAAQSVNGKLHPRRRTSIDNPLDVSEQPQNTGYVRLIIKGTAAMPQQDNCPSYTNTFTVNRSLSLQSQRQAALLAPKRQDRIKLEKWLHDIWTTDILPYPGMPAWRGERLIRSSANLLIRKLSHRRLFMKRSNSVATNVSVMSTASVASNTSAASTPSTMSTATGRSTLDTCSGNINAHGNVRSGESAETATPFSAMKRKNSCASVIILTEKDQLDHHRSRASQRHTTYHSSSFLSSPIAGSTPEEEKTAMQFFSSLKPRRCTSSVRQPPPTPLQRTASRMPYSRSWSATWAGASRRSIARLSEGNNARARAMTAVTGEAARGQSRGRR